MDTKSKAVLDSALALPETERARIAQELLASIAPEFEELSEDEFVAELDRRFEECRRDPSATVPWSDLKDRD